MTEPTATNPQTGEKLVFRGGQWQPTGASPASPTAPGVIYGRPKVAPAPTPKNSYDVQTDQRDFADKQGEQAFGNEQSLRKEFYGLPAVKEYQVAARTYANALQAADDASGDQSLITAYAKMLDPGSVVREGEAAAVAGTDTTIGRSIATLAKEFGWAKGGTLSPDIRAKIRREMKTLADNYGASYDQERGQFTTYAGSHGIRPENVVGQHLFDPYRETVEEYWSRQQAATPPITEEDGLTGAVTYEGPNQYSDDAKGIAASRSDGQTGLFGPAGGFLDDAATLGKQGITLGLADEAAGLGGAISALLTGGSVRDGYTNNRDAERIRVEQARERLGWGGTALELAGGGAGALSRAGSVISAGRRAAAAGNLTREGVQGQLVRQATRGGAGIGALGGFGYGEGLEGSAGNALVGAVAGGVLGNVGQRAGNALANRVRPALDPVRAREVAAAGQAEGVTVNRAMVDPTLENTFSAVETTRAGGPRINRAMDEVEGQIEGRVAALGGGRQPLDRTAVGDKVQRAGDRFITESADVTSRKYTQAERLAGDAMVRPVRAKAVADQMAQQLSQTGNINSGEIAFLKGISEDLSKPLTISALRDMRTTLRKKISKGELVFGQNESRVLAIMDEAAQDIRTGLTQQGKAAAADAFSAADTAYAARMDYIKNTVQKLIGKRDSNMSAEQVASKFESMARSDAEGLRKFWVALEPSERGDMRATFAEALGRNNKGEFSPAIFLNNIGGNNRKMSERAIRTVFGNDGAESLKNLKVLATEVNRLNAKRNASNTGRGNDYRSWLMDMTLGGGGAGAVGLISGGVGTGAIAAAGGAAVAAGGKAARDIINARMLLNPKIQKWLANAPRTQGSKAIDAHFNRLGDIAKAEPGLAGDIEVFRKAIFGAANDNAGALAAENQDAEERR